MMEELARKFGALVPLLLLMSRLLFLKLVSLVISWFLERLPPPWRSWLVSVGSSADFDV